MSPTVLAEAVVRSRDGRSVLDWDEDGAEPVKAYTADPTRLHTAMTALEELGFTVDGSDTVSVRFRGPAAAYTTAFGVTPAMAADGGWRVAGATDFDVDAAGPLGGALHRVLLTAEPSATRSIKMTPAFREVTPTDLMLGEIGPSLGVAVPGRIANGQPFPADDHATALAATRATLDAWAADPLRTYLRGLIEFERARRGDDAMVQTMLLDPGGDRRLPAAFARLWPHPPGPPPAVRPAGRTLRFTAVDFVDDVFAGDDGWTHPALDRVPAECLLRRLHPAWSRIAAPLREVRELARHPAAQFLAGLGRRWPALRTDLVAVVAMVREVLAGNADGAVEMDDDMLDRAVADIAAVGAAMAAADAVATQTCWRSLDGFLGGRLTGWIAAQVPHFRAMTDAVRSRRGRHAAMVSSDFLAVTLGAVDATLYPRYDLLWEATATGKWIFNFSAGRRVPGGLVAADLRQERQILRARLAGRQARRVLYVLAAGNHDDRPDDGPLVNAVFAADAGNVLVVGGCEPDVHGWHASDATHGYSVTLRVNGRRSRPVSLSIPHVCAATKGQTGGSAVFAQTPYDVAVDGPLTWLSGGGSSQSTPIVSAVCSLVWNAFPQLSAAQVKDAVLAGAVPLDGGSFHFPSIGYAGIDPGSNDAQHHPGAQRVVLHGALVAALRTVGGTLGAPLAALAAPPVGVAS